MDYRALTKNYVYAFSAQGISFLVSVVMSFLVPKVLGVEEFGYWQLFIFYTSYVGFFHLGLNDGVYLLHGGEVRSGIDKRAINSELWVGICYQLIFALFIVGYTLLFGDEGKRSFVLFATAVFLLLNNVSTYLGYVLQAMNETRLFSISTMIDRLVFLVPLCSFVVLGESHFEPFVMAYAVSKTCSLAFCLWVCRDVLRARIYSARRSCLLVVKSIKVGINLLLANVADMLVLGVARFLIDANWGIEAFGEVSFSLSLVNFFITFISQASMVMFPSLRQSSVAEQRSFYASMRDALEFVSPAVLLIYAPMVFVLSAWLPQYRESLSYFALLLPICMYNGKMSICCSTYFKVLRQERLLLLVNVATALAGGLLSVVGIYVFQSIEFVMLGIVIAFVMRSSFSELWLNRWLHVAGSSMLFGEILLTVAFVVMASCTSLLATFLLYALLYGAYAFANRRTFSQIARLAWKVTRRL